MPCYLCRAHMESKPVVLRIDSSWRRQRSVAEHHQQIIRDSTYCILPPCAYARCVCVVCSGPALYRWSSEFRRRNNPHDWHSRSSGQEAWQTQTVPLEATMPYQGTQISIARTMMLIRYQQFRRNFAREDTHPDLPNPNSHFE